jgi:hypothetical protein
MEYLILENITSVHKDFFNSTIFTYDSIKLFDKFINLENNQLDYNINNIVLYYAKNNCFDVINYICKNYNIKWDDILNSNYRSDIYVSDQILVKLCHIISFNENNLPSFETLINYPPRCLESFKIILGRMPEDNSNMDMINIVNYITNNNSYSHILKLLHQKYSKSFGILGTSKIYKNLQIYYDNLKSYYDNMILNCLPEDLDHLYDLIIYFKSCCEDT